MHILHTPPEQLAQNMAYLDTLLIPVVLLTEPLTAGSEIFRTIQSVAKSAEELDRELTGRLLTLPVQLVRQPQEVLYLRQGAATSTLLLLAAEKDEAAFTALCGEEKNLLYLTPQPVRKLYEEVLRLWQNLA